MINLVPAGRELGAYLVAHPGVDKILHRVHRGGRASAKPAAALLRPVTLELGGKSAAIVLDDADLDASSAGLFTATLLNNGQTCFLGTRVLAPRPATTRSRPFDGLSRSRSWATRSTKRPRSVRWPTAGPRDRVEGYIDEGQGGRRTASPRRGRPRERKRAGSSNRRLRRVDNPTPSQQEIFGPVLSIIPYSDDRKRSDRQRLRLRTRRDGVDQRP